MDEIVIAAMARWPNVPEVHGWLALDRRGQWRLQDSPITNPHITEFIGRNYLHDKRGAWYFQNGPQRVYVALDYVPWVLRIGNAGQLVTHTDASIQDASAALLDEQGNLLIEFANGVGLVDDRDLPALLEAIVDADGNAAAETDLIALMEGIDLPQPPRLHLKVNLGQQATSLPLTSISSTLVPARFGFVANPQPEQTAAD